MGRNYFCHFRGNILSSESTQNHLWRSEKYGSPAPALQNSTFPVWNRAWASRFKHASDDARVQAGLQTPREGEGTKGPHPQRSWRPLAPAPNKHREVAEVAAWRTWAWPEGRSLGAEALGPGPPPRPLHGLQLL